MTDPAPLEVLPDLTLVEAGDLWGVISRKEGRGHVVAGQLSVSNRAANMLKLF